MLASLTHGIKMRLWCPKGEAIAIKSSSLALNSTTQRLNNNTSSSFPAPASISGLSSLCLDTQTPRPKAEQTLSFHSGLHPQLSATLCFSSPFMAVATKWKMLSPPAATSFFLRPAFTTTSFIYFPLQSSFMQTGG